MAANADSASSTPSSPSLRAAWRVNLLCKVRKSTPLRRHERRRACTSKCGAQSGYCSRDSLGRARHEVHRNNETTVVKHDRTESVGHDETITIGIDRSERGNNNEKIPIGANRTDTVGEKKPSPLTPSAQSSPSPGDRDRALATHAVGIDETVSVARCGEVTIGAFQAVPMVLTKA